MSGLPGGRRRRQRADLGGELPWDSPYLDIRDYQWNEVAIPFWKDIEARAARRRRQGLHRDAPAQPRLQPGHAAAPGRRDRRHPRRRRDGPQPPVLAGHRPGRAVEHLGELVYNAAAKDTRINEATRKVNGVLDDRFARTPADREPARARRPQHAQPWPRARRGSSSRSAAGHDVEFWVPVPAALDAVDPDMAVNIEHEDQEFDQIEGLRLAAENLLAAAGRA